MSVSSRLGICLVSWLQCIVWFHGKYVYIQYNSLKDKITVALFTVHAVSRHFDLKSLAELHFSCSRVGILVAFSFFPLFLFSWSEIGNDHLWPSSECSKSSVGLWLGCFNNLFLNFVFLQSSCGWRAWEEFMEDVCGIASGLWNHSRALSRH